MAEHLDALDLLIRLAPGDLAELISPRPDWHRRSACRGVGPELFYPERGESVAPAKALCARCEVREPCAEAGESELHGIWAGMAPKGRAALRRSAAA